jgi:tryptophan-rich sensory protein
MIDPRGPRFSAAVTTVVLAVVLLTGSTFLLFAQALVFALGTADRSPYGVLYKRLIRPRLGPPAELEDARPPRFAQTVGVVFALLALAGAIVWAPLFYAATAAALAAAFLNAAFGFCLGCEMYLTYKKLTTKEIAA